jgi:hypothetical protein
MRRAATIEVGGFCMGRPRQTARATISSGKLENRLSLPMEKPKLPHGLYRRVRLRGEKTAKKNFSRFIPRNPLISLDSDERIQGNPRKSNPQNRGFRGETARSQENPNRIVWTRRGPPPPLVSLRLARPDSCPHHEASQRPDGGERGQAGAPREVEGCEMRKQ